jgi:two-component system KDP operon response regulator KdpE
VRVAIRHLTRARGKDEPVFHTRELRVDLAGRMVWVAGAEVHLTPIEFKLLAVLVLHCGKAVTQRQLLQEGCGYHSDEQAHYFRNYIHHLRHKLAADPARPVYLNPGWGIA